MFKRTFIAIALVLTGAIANVSARAGTVPNVDENTRYLALGDSLAFGCDPTTFTSLDKCVGYTQLVADALHKKYADASCPGETSGSFVSVSAPDFGCQQWKSVPGRMFIPYTGSQLAYATLYLQSNPVTKLITINIGGNDLALLQISCGGDPTCISTQVMGTLAQTGTNLAQILQAIRGNYSGPLVLLTYYCFNYTDPLQFGAFSAINSVITSAGQAYGAKIADGFGAFQTASAPYNGDACAAGLLLKAADGTCGTHPSLQGHQLLANAILAAIGNQW